MCIYDVTGKNKLVRSICQQSEEEEKKKKDSKLIFSTRALALTKIIDWECKFIQVIRLLQLELKHWAERSFIYTIHLFLPL